MKVQKEIMNLIYVCFSNRQFFFPQDLKFFSIIFLTIFNSISQKYVDQYLPKLKRHYGFKTWGRSVIPLIKQKRLLNSYFFFLFLFYFCRLYFSAFTIFNAVCKTCKSLIPHFLQCMHLPLFLFFPPTKNKKTRVASNFRGDFIWFCFNYSDGGWGMYVGRKIPPSLMVVFYFGPFPVPGTII